MAAIHAIAWEPMTQIGSVCIICGFFSLFAFLSTFPLCGKSPEDSLTQITPYTDGQTPEMMKQNGGLQNMVPVGM